MSVTATDLDKKVSALTVTLERKADEKIVLNALKRAGLSPIHRGTHREDYDSGYRCQIDLAKGVPASDVVYALRQIRVDEDLLGVWEVSEPQSGKTTTEVSAYLPKDHCFKDDCRQPVAYSIGTKESKVFTCTTHKVEAKQQVQAKADAASGELQTLAADYGFTSVSASQVRKGGKVAVYVTQRGVSKFAVQIAGQITAAKATPFAADFVSPRAAFIYADALLEEVADL